MSTWGSSLNYLDILDDGIFALNFCEGMGEDVVGVRIMCL